MLRKKLKKQTNIKGYFHARATHICECVFVWADYERFPNSSDSTKSCLVIQFTATSTQPWPLTPSPLTWKLCPFGAAISWLYKGGSGTEGDWGWKWRGRIINYQHNDHNCVQVLPSVLERSTSKDLRAPQPAAHRTFTTEGKPRTLTGLEAEAQNVYKQLAMLTNNKGRNCQGHSGFPTSKKWSQTGRGVAVRSVYDNSGVSDQIWTNTENTTCRIHVKVSILIQHQLNCPPPPTLHSLIISFHSSQGWSYSLWGHEARPASRQRLLSRHDSLGWSWLQADLKLDVRHATISSTVKVTARTRRPDSRGRVWQTSCHLLSTANCS